MIARIRKSIEEKDQGFTLIELLVVMIIIGILAAIAIPVFLNQQKKAAETAAKADASTISKAITSYYVDGSGALTVGTNAGKWEIKDASNAVVDSGNLSSGNKITGQSKASDATTWCVAIDPSGKVTGANTWRMSSVDGLTKATC